MNSALVGSAILEVEALEQRELLQHHRALRPRAGLAQGVAAVVVGERRLDVGLPARHVVAGEHAAMGLAAHVHHLLRAAEAVDRLGDEALRPGLARGFDLLDAIAAGALGLAQHARIGLGQRLVGEERAGRRHLAAGKIDRRRGRPIVAKEVRDRRDGCIRALDQGMAVGGVGRSRAPARRRAAWCRSRAAASSRCRTCRGRRPRAGRCPAPCRGRGHGNARWWPWPAPAPGRRSPRSCPCARR